MEKTLIIKITMTGGKVLEVEKAADAANLLAEQITANGYLDALSGRFYPPEAVVQIEIGPPDQFGEGWFSEN